MLFNSGIKIVIFYYIHLSISDFENYIYIKIFDLIK